MLNPYLVKRFSSGMILARTNNFLLNIALRNTLVLFYFFLKILYKQLITNTT
jgi:hypothetical protein